MPDTSSVRTRPREREPRGAAAKRWGESHRDQARAAPKNWQKSNPHLVRAQKRHWYRRHREEIEAKNKRHYWENRDRIRVALKSVRDKQRQQISAEGLKVCRKDPREARRIKGPGFIVCLECGAMLESLVIHLKSEHHINTGEYKEKWGYNRKTGLI